MGPPTLQWVDGLRDQRPDGCLRRANKVQGEGPPGGLASLFVLPGRAMNRGFLRVGGGTGVERFLRAPGIE
jgi:hypothetical protein